MGITMPVTPGALQNRVLCVSTHMPRAQHPVVLHVLSSTVTYMTGPAGALHPRRHIWISGSCSGLYTASTTQVPYNNVWLFIWQAQYQKQASTSGGTLPAHWYVPARHRSHRTNCQCHPFTRTRSQIHSVRHSALHLFIISKRHYRAVQ